jgi:predicted N-acetyltransferase YhbS
MSVTIRPLREEDIEAILRIERSITQSERTGALATNIRRYLAREDPMACLGAEIDGDLAGFIIGETRPWDFGEEEEVGWIKILGVDPRHQGKGVGKQLGEAILDHFRGKGITKIRTLVEWDAGDVIAYFRSLGFSRGSLIALERDMD